jgi:hypothetical protein
MKVGFVLLLKIYEIYTARFAVLRILEFGLFRFGSLLLAVIFYHHSIIYYCK